MSFADLRHWLRRLEESGDLVTVTKPVSVVHEIAAYIRKSSDTDGPAFVFTDVKEHPGWRVLAATYAVRRRILSAMECQVEEMVHKYVRATAQPLPSRRVNAEAPCQEVVWSGEQVDLNALPIVTHSEKDAAFITCGVQVAPDPDTGVQGLGIHRMQRFGKNKLGLWAPAERRVGRAVIKSNERGKPQPLAVVIGPDPHVELAAAARVPHTVEKYDIGSALKGEPVTLVRCKTIDCWVPANAELIIEGLVYPEEFSQESPFGEFPGTYGGNKRVPLMTVTAITMRKDPLYQTCLTGFPVTEDHLMNWPAMAAVVWADAIRVAPEVKAVDVRGNYVYKAVVAMRKRHENEPWNVITSVLAGNAQAKYCMVVDEDVNIFDERDLDWAECTRVQPHQDIHIFPVMVGAPLDPSAPMLRQTAKMGINATVPLSANREEYQRVLVPGADTVTW